METFTNSLCAPGKPSDIKSPCIPCDSGILFLKYLIIHQQYLIISRKYLIISATLYRHGFAIVTPTALLLKFRFWHFYFSRLSRSEAVTIVLLNTNSSNINNFAIVRLFISVFGLINNNSFRTYQTVDWHYSNTFFFVHPKNILRTKVTGYPDRITEYLNNETEQLGHRKDKAE